jgi:hypothetical protein
MLPGQIPSYGTSYGTVPATVSIDSETEPLRYETTSSLQSVPNAVPVVDVSPHWRDVGFAIAFWIHAALMIWMGVWLAPAGYENFDFNFDLTAIEDEMRKSDDVTDAQLEQFDEIANRVAEYVKVYPTRIVFYLVVPCGILAFFIAFLVTVLIVKPFSKTVAYASLLGSLFFSAFLLTASAIASGSFFMFLMTGFALAIIIYYILIAWRMVPFAAVNLKVALAGMNRNFGIYFVGFLFAELGVRWIVFWVYTLVGVASKENTECHARHPDANFDVSSADYDGVCEPPFVVVLFFLLSLYWTTTVAMVRLLPLQSVSFDDSNACVCLSKVNPHLPL